MTIHENIIKHRTVTERGRNIVREWHKFSECHPSIHSAATEIILRKISRDIDCCQDNICIEIATSYDHIHRLIYRIEAFGDNIYSIQNSYKQLYNASKYWVSLTSIDTCKYASDNDLLEFFNEYEWTYVYTDIPMMHKIFSKTVAADLISATPMSSPTGLLFYH